MSLARAQTRTAQSQDKCTNHEATVPPLDSSVLEVHWTLGFRRKEKKWQTERSVQNHREGTHFFQVTVVAHDHAR